MRRIEVSRDIRAPKGDVWAVLADFPNIYRWNSGIKRSFSTSESTGGVGAQRHCDLAPAGGLDETVVEWEPERRMAISIDSTSKTPIRRGLATFEVTAVDTGARTSIEYEYDTKWGLIGRLMGPMLDKQLSKGFAGFLVDLEQAALEPSA